MKTLIEKLGKIVVDYSPALNNISAEDFSIKPGPSKWSKKEILGHLVDSAQNNIRRFIVSQYEDIPNIIYKQDQWVSIVNYQQYQESDLIMLWSLLNRQVCSILSNTSETASKRKCETNDLELHTIEWLAGDYIKHLLHHLHQILEMEQIPYP